MTWRSRWVRRFRASGRRLVTRRRRTGCGRLIGRPRRSSNWGRVRRCRCRCGCWIPRTCPCSSLGRLVRRAGCLGERVRGRRGRSDPGRHGCSAAREPVDDGAVSAGRATAVGGRFAAADGLLEGVRGLGADSGGDWCFVGETSGRVIAQSGSHSGGGWSLDGVLGPVRAEARTAGPGSRKADRSPVADRRDQP